MLSNNAVPLFDGIFRVRFILRGLALFSGEWKVENGLVHSPFSILLVVFNF